MKTRLTIGLDLYKRRWNIYNLREAYARWAIHEPHLPVEGLSVLFGPASPDFTCNAYVGSSEAAYRRQPGRG
jgi:hypothetical protein